MLSFLDPHKGGINIGELGMLGDLFGIGTQRLHVAQGGLNGVSKDDPVTYSRGFLCRVNEKRTIIYYNIL